MALSGKHLVAALGLLLMGACGTGPAVTEGNGTVREVATTAAVVSQPQPGNDGSIKMGAPITTEGAKPLETLFAGQLREPVTAAGSRVIVKSMPAGASPDTHGFSYDLWDPDSGEAHHLWETEPGTQDLVSGSDGAWAAVVHTGLELPLTEWQLSLRNVGTGATRELAESSEAVADVEGLPVGPPTGFAPVVAMTRTHAAWAEFVPGEEGRVEKVIRVHDIAANLTSTVFTVRDALVGDAWAPALGGTKLAFATRATPGSPVTIVIRDLESGEELRVGDVGEPFAVALTGDGSTVAWDDHMQAKRAMELESGSRTTFAGALGWGVQTSGAFVSWTPASGRGGAAGYYDTETRTLHVRQERADMMANLGQVMGPWFVWQEQPVSGMNPGTYYLRRIR